MKIIVAGSRSFTDYNLLKDTLNYILSSCDKENIQIVSGTARGADSLGEKYAEENNISVVKFPADWDKHGRSAGYIRNYEMIKYAGIGGMLVAFYDGISRGTYHTISTAKEKGLAVTVIYY